MAEPATHEDGKSRNGRILVFYFLALKIYHMQKEVERTDTTPEHHAQCKAKLDILLEQKQDLSSAIDQLLADIESGKK